MKTVSFEQLAEKLNGKLWVKGDIKRIYLDRGYNTKKMSTKTYVEEVNGEFITRCYIECSSQPYNWVKSQQEEVIESVEKEIENIIKLLNIELIESKLTDDKTEVKVLISFNGGDNIWYSENEFYNFCNEYPENVFDNLPQVELPQKQNIEPLINFDIKSTEEGFVNDFEIGKTYNNTRFGNGICEAEDDNCVVINFESEGQKKFIKKFVKLTLVNG